MLRGQIMGGELIAVKTGKGEYFNISYIVL